MESAIRVERIVVRGLSERFVACERTDKTTPIVLERAQAQHRAYVDAMRRLVGAVSVVDAQAATPDCVFIEDAAVVINSRVAVLARPGAPSRRAEVGPVEQHLKSLGMDVRVMREPALLDGGDVLRVGSRLFIGLSSRTNPAGATFLADVAREHGLEAVTMAVTKGLHLKSACSLADEGLLLYDAEVGLDLAPFAAAGLRCLPAPERLGGNVLALGQGRVCVSAGSPKTAEFLAGECRLEVTPLDIGEFHTADAALTCLSLRLPPPGAWCT